MGERNQAGALETESDHRGRWLRVAGEGKASVLSGSKVRGWQAHSSNRKQQVQFAEYEQICLRVKTILPSLVYLINKS